MDERLSGRDRSGRMPRASRGDTFYQSWHDYTVPGPTPEILPPMARPAPPEPAGTDDLARGGSY